MTSQGYTFYEAVKGLPKPKKGGKRRVALSPDGVDEPPPSKAKSKKTSPYIEEASLPEGWQFPARSKLPDPVWERNAAKRKEPLPKRLTSSQEVDADFCASFMSLLKEGKKDLTPDPHSSRASEQSRACHNAATAAITVHPPTGRSPSFVSPAVGTVFHFRWKKDVEETARKPVLPTEDVTFDVDLEEPIEFDQMDEVVPRSDALIPPHPPPVVAATSGLSDLFLPRTASAMHIDIDDDDDDYDLFNELVDDLAGEEAAGSIPVEQSGGLDYISLERSQPSAIVQEVEEVPPNDARPKKPLPKTTPQPTSILSDPPPTLTSRQQLPLPGVCTTDLHPEDDVGISQSTEQISRRKLRALPRRKPTGKGSSTPECSRVLSTSSVDSDLSCSSASSCSSSSGSEIEMPPTPFDTPQLITNATLPLLVSEPEVVNINTGSYQTSAAGLDHIFGIDNQLILSKAPSAETSSPPTDFNFPNGSLNSFAYPAPVSVVTDITGRQMVVHALSNPAPQPNFTLPPDLSILMSQNTTASFDFSLPMPQNMAAPFDFPNANIPPIPDFGPLPSADLPVQANPFPQMDLASSPLTNQLQALMGLDDAAFANLSQQFPLSVSDPLPTTIDPIHTLNDPFSNMYGWSSQPAASVIPTNFLSEFLGA
jgi:hypothetical protein